jgi:MerR family transcriptional regulator/heat shock protein HspR
MPEPGNDNPLYSIGTVARLLGVSVQTLRLYEAEGLILPRKSEGGQRRYSQADLERLECIRAAITEDKISIQGIRRIQSLIPCWQMVQCPEKQRLACPAFHEHQAGCWTYRHERNACAGRDCRRCEAYRVGTSCADIKKMIFQGTRLQSSEAGAR